MCVSNEVKETTKPLNLSRYKFVKQQISEHEFSLKIRYLDSYTDKRNAETNFLCNVVYEKLLQCIFVHY